MPWKPPDKTLSNGLFYILYILVNFHISQEIIFVSWLLGWLSSIHSGCLWYQPGNTFWLTVFYNSGWLPDQPGYTFRCNLVDFLLYILADLLGWLPWLISSIHSGWLSYQPRNTFGCDSVDILPYIMVDFHVSQKILFGWPSYIHSSWLSYQPGNTFRLTNLVDFFAYILVDFHISQEIFSGDLFGWLFWLTFFYVYTFWLTFISTRKYFPVYLFGGLSSIHSGWLSCQPGNTLGWLLGWLSSIHSYWISYQPGNTFRLTYLVDFFGWLSSILSSWI